MTFDLSALKNKSTATGEIAKHVCYYQNVFSLFYAVVYLYYK